jgi:hypothetical protein
MQSDNRARSSIARQWIKANALGAAVNAVTGFVVYGLAKLLEVDGAEVSRPVLFVFSALSVFFVTSGIAIYGFLLAVVLRQKLRMFPLQNWMAIYAAFGVLLGVLTSYTATFADAPDPEPVTGQTIRGLLLGAAIGGAVVGGVMGALQALVLRGVAHGLDIWIRFSALAGTVLALVVLVTLVGPQAGFANEVLTEAATFAASVIAAFIMLPAVERLEPH